MTNPFRYRSNVISYTYDIWNYSLVFVLSIEGSEENVSGKEGTSFTGEEEFFYCIFGLSKNPLGLVDSIHAVWKKGKISILKRRLIC